MAERVELGIRKRTSDEVERKVEICLWWSGSFSLKATGISLTKEKYVKARLIS